MRDGGRLIVRFLAALAAAVVCASPLLLPADAREGFGAKISQAVSAWLPAKRGEAPSVEKPAAVSVKRDTAETAREQAPAVSVMAASIPPKMAGGGTVTEEVLAGGIHLSGGVYYKNRSDLAVNFAAYDGADCGVTLTPGAPDPQVLILHTHTTESYMSYYAGYFNKGDLIRTPDSAHNVCVVGEVLANRLRAAGIATVHATAVHDQPQYVGSYGRSAETVQKTLKKYPSIRLVIDLHRDAVQRSNTDKIKPTVTVDGDKAAQMMLIVCADDPEEDPNPLWEQNVALALAVQHDLTERYDGLMRPVGFTDIRYNEASRPGFLVEVGSETNTFAEAMTSAALLGDALVRVLT
ncbi:MAG: stage II sporulation protein P [Clostridia bacterium]|nr:stage II sporulation protein P [Clostridia bacterium]